MEVEVNVGCDEKIELAIAIVIDKSATGAPGLARTGYTGFSAHITEGTVAIVVVKNIFSVVGDVQVVESVVVVVANASSLTPTRMTQAGLFGDIGEGAVVIIVVQVAGRRVRSVKRIERGSIDDENVRPAVIFVVKYRHAGASGFDDVFFDVHSAKDDFCSQAGLLSLVGEISDGFGRGGCRIVLRDKTNSGEQPERKGNPEENV